MSTALTLVDNSLTYAETLRPNSFDALVKFAERMSRTAFVPKSFHGKPDDIVAAVMFGAELGLAPLQSLQNVAVVNGRPTIWGDAALAVCQAHPAWEWIRETHEGAGDARVAVCEVKRRGMDAHVVRFGAADAKRAGLWGKDTYKAYPDRMLQMRARGFALRNTFADALKGLITREEAEDFEPQRAEVIQTEPAPSAAHRVMQKLDSPGPVREALAKMNAAKTMGELKTAAESAKSLPAEQQEEARALYKVRAQQIREEEWRANQTAKAAEPPHGPGAGEVPGGKFDDGPAPMREEDVPEEFRDERGPGED